MCPRQAFTPSAILIRSRILAVIVELRCLTSLSSEFRRCNSHPCASRCSWPAPSCQLFLTSHTPEAIRKSLVKLPFASTVSRVFSIHFFAGVTTSHNPVRQQPLVSLLFCQLSRLTKSCSRSSQGDLVANRHLRPKRTQGATSRATSRS